MSTDDATSMDQPPAAGLREQVRDHYAAAAQAVLDRSGASCCGPTAATQPAATDGPGATAQPASTDDPAAAAEPTADEGAGASCCGPAATTDIVDAERFGSALYGVEDQDVLPEAAVLASLGCGNPTAVAELREGETVLDLGSGGGIDVLLSARRVGPTGRAIGLDMTEEMLELARRNAEEAGVENVEFLAGTMEEIPLADASVDVVISNCVINLSTDKAAVFAEIARILRPGGRVGVSDVVAEDRLSVEDRAARGDHVGCVAGALSVSEYREHLARVGLVDAEVELTHEVADGLHGAIVRARRPR